MRIIALILMFVHWAFLTSAAASPELRTEAQFRSWLTGQVWEDARKRGVSRDVFDEAINGLTLDWSLPGPDVPGKPDVQHQAEFSSPGKYFSEKHLTILTRNGRTLLKTHADLLGKIERRYGIPREIIVAIWGRESNFGRAEISLDAVRTLATMAYVGERRDFFYPEFLAVFEMLGKQIRRSDLKSSWAGALGQPQFLPSVYLNNAVDFDGDGRRDIWRSTADSLASIAHFLQTNGWRNEFGWGFEVVAPPEAPCTLEGPDKGQSLQVWEDLGVRRRDGGKSIRNEALSETAFLLMPAGRLGPAFLVSSNFYVLKLYNESDLYALFIGHVGDRFRGEARIAEQWSVTTNFLRSDVTAMQKQLERQGRDVGGADGLVGFKTRVAIGDWQRTNQRPITCYPDRDLIRRISLP